MPIVLGTHNRKKRAELEDLLRPLGIGVQTLDDYPQAIEVVEDGETFAENARKKAVGQARHLGRWVLAEDSGLVVEALGGAPGVYSARYAGVGATDEANNRKLVAALASVPIESRGAYYVCHAVFSDPTGQVRGESDGKCRGRMRTEPSGEGGFGYDPYFEIPEYHQTFGTLGSTVKRCLSHRGRAMRGLIPLLLRLRSEIEAERA